jgi:TRAP-type C4-dicarboxylate transport system permease small subunit
MDRIVVVMGRCNQYLCGFCLAVMVIVVFVNTVLRYCFNSGIIVAEELVRYLFVWATYLAVISVYYDHNHIAVTTIVDRLSPRMRAVFAVITSALALFGLGILVQGSVMYFLETTNMGQVTGIPYKFVVAPVLLAAISCGVIVLNDLFATFRALARGAGLEG